MASAVGGARDGRGETPRTLETYPRVTSEPGGARGLFRGVPPPRARRRRRVRRDARPWHGLGYDEATWEPEEDASEAAVAAATESAKRRDEEERAAREDAGSPGGKRRRRERRRRRRAKFRGTPPPPGAPSSRGWGNRTTRATRWTRRRCTPRARESRRVTETPISRRSWRRVGGVFARAARDPPPSKPAPESRGRGAAGALAFEDFEHLLQRAGTGHGVDAAANRRKAEAAALAAGEQARGPRGGQLDGASNTAGASDLHPRGLALHEYQRQGVLWMLDKLRSGRGAILGDQMGLREDDPDGCFRGRGARAGSPPRARAGGGAAVDGAQLDERAQNVVSRFELRDVRRKPSVAGDTSNARVSAADDA